MTEVASNAIVAPDFTGTVNQEFFIEPHGGPRNPKSYLENFPETLYTHDINSNLSALLYALLGPAGMGWLRKNHLIARLDVEALGLSTVNLDELYANPLGFARLAEEAYDFIPQGLLTTEQWEKIQRADAAYRNRAIDYLKAVRAGGTLKGLTLAARSGLNRPVEVVENYRALYDRYSDNPLGLTYYGATESTEEVVVLPRQNVPTSAIQTIIFNERPTKGTFTIQVPLGAQANSVTEPIPFNSTFDAIQNALDALPVLRSPKATLPLAWVSEKEYAEGSYISYEGRVYISTKLIKAKTEVAFTPANWTLKGIGPTNVIVRGGPAPADFTVSFTNELADHPIPQLIVDSKALENLEGKQVIVTVEVDQVGVTADGEEAAISSQDWSYVTKAIGNIKPVTTILTPGKAQGITRRQVAATEHADSNFTEVLRYVTGLNSVKWPTVDSTHWIEAGVENEGPVSQYAQQHHYSNFHNITATAAYTDEALAFPEYGKSVVPIQYSSEHTGPFSIYEKALYPFLSEFSDPKLKFASGYSLANPPEPLTVQAVVSGSETVNLINNIYPTEYQGLPGVAQVPTTSNFWASLERIEGSEFLEIDLGKVQAVNYLSFQATNKPFDIAVTYDVLDMAPARRFVPVTLVDQKVIDSTTSLGYDITATNPWKSCTMYFNNRLGNFIFTRFIRIEFTRRPGFPFLGTNNTALPFGIQVKSLRAGRNLS